MYYSSWACFHAVLSIKEPVKLLLLTVPITFMSKFVNFKCNQRKMNTSQLTHFNINYSNNVCCIEIDLEPLTFINRHVI